MAFDTTRKFWGWGVTTYEVPPPMLDLARAFLAARFPGAPPAAPRPVPTLDALRMPAPAIAPSAAPASLSACLTDARFDRAAHTYGKAYRDVVRALDGDFSPAPDLVAYPRTEDEVAALLGWASEARLAVIPFGGGSSVCGGVEADAASRARYAGVVSLDLCHLDRVLEIDRVSRCARVQAGTYGPALEAQLKPHGYTLRHFPQSFEFSTVGGWIATRAGGHYATLYTHVDDFVESLRMVTPRGTLVTRRLPGNGAGPQEERLVLGSEGALGIVTEAWLRVQDLPRHRASATVRFETFAAGASACRMLAQSGLFPSNARLVEREEALFMGAGDGQHHVLVLAFESATLPQDEKLAAAIALSEAEGGVAKRRARRAEGAEGDAAEQWKQSFVRAPYLRDELARLGYLSETFETCTTWSGFPALDRAIRDAARAVLTELCGDGVVTCRFTHLYPDGPAPYYTIIAPSRASDQLRHWDAVKEAVSRAILEQGATITHHHAVGKDHRRFYEAQVSPLTLEMLRAAKRTVDPEGIMNPGTLLPAG